MKRVIIFLILTMSALLLFSCKADGDSPAAEGAVYGTGIDTVIISNHDAADSNYNGNIMALAEALASKDDKSSDILNDTAEKAAHEIVVGNTSREITAKAYEQLAKRIKHEVRTSADEAEAEKDTVGYAVYASGGSVAIVWSDARLLGEETVWADWIVAQEAINYFINNYIIASSLELKEGYVRTETFSISEHLEKRGDKIIADKWMAVEEALGEEYGASIVKELKTLYGLFNDDKVVSWFANLYDPAVGGWYWSNSARDNEGYLPSIEETYTMLYLVEDTGMAEAYDNDWSKAMPSWLLEQVGDFVYNLQDENGFFYHPQWPKEYIEANDLQSRITRDVGSANNILTKLGITPKYAIPTASKVDLSGRLGQSTVAAVSKVIAASDEMLSQYESVENFAEYLAGIDAELATTTNPDDWAYKFYEYGNKFQSTTKYINKNPELKKMLIAFFDKHQNPKTGLWSEIVCYNATNGLHKIAHVYNSVGAELKYVDQMVLTVTEILCWDPETHPAGAGVYIYNAWSCYPYIYNNLRKYGSGTPQQNEAKCLEIKSKVLELAPSMIRGTFNQLLGFLRDDGSFSYSRSGNQSTAQGCPISVPGTVEGDVNGHSCSTTAMSQNIFAALELSEYEVPYFTEAERVKFVRILNELDGVIKYNESLGEDITYDFEDTAVGEVPGALSVKLDANRNSIDGTFIQVSEERSGNHVMEFVAKHRGSDADGRNYTLSVPVQNLVADSTAGILEFKIKVSSESDKNQIIRINFRGTASATIYPSISLSKDGTVSIYDADGAFVADIGRADEYIDLKIEYYWEKEIYKVYVDGTYRGSGSATYQNFEHSKVTSIIFGSDSSTTAHYFIDDLRAVTVKKLYTDGAKELAPEKVYSFEKAGELPSDITVSGEYSIIKDENAGGVLKTQGSTVKVLANMRSYMAMSALVELDISPETVSEAELSAIGLYNEKDVLLWQLTVGVNSDGKYYLYDSKCLERADTDISADTEALSLRIEHHWGLGKGECELALRIYVGDSEEPIATSCTPYTVKYLRAPLTYVTLTTADTPVLYDNIRSENRTLSFTPDEIPTVGGSGSYGATIDFEGSDIGPRLPSGIKGDAEVGARLDGSDRYLEITDLSKEEEKAVTVTPYGNAESATHVRFEMNIEYLKSTFERLSDFYIVDESGKQVCVVYLQGYNYLGPAPHIRAYCKNSNGVFSMIDSAPNVVDRYYYLRGEGYTSYKGPYSETTLSITVELATGDVTVTYRGMFSATYKNLVTSVSALKIVSGKAGVSVLTIDDLTAEYINENEILSPTPEDFENGYTASEKTWECTHKDALGVASSAWNLSFESGAAVDYADESATNEHGATAKVLEDTETGNKYLNITAPKRINGRDRSHSLRLYTENCTFKPNAYVYEIDLKLDSLLPDGSESHESYLQIIFRGASGQYVQYNMKSSDSGMVNLVGIPLAKWDEWFTLRLEYYTSENVIQVYVKNSEGEYEYRGNLETATASSSKTDFTPAVLAGSVSSVDINGANNKSNGFSLNIDNAMLSSTKLEYDGEQEIVLPEIPTPEPDPDDPGTGGGTTDPDNPTDPDVGSDSGDGTSSEVLIPDFGEEQPDEESGEPNDGNTGDWTYNVG